MTLFDLKGKVAVVTGGNGGIGLGMARGLARAGARIVVAARNPDKGRAAVTELERLGTDAIFCAVDVANEASVEAMVQQTVGTFGGLDILVNNAGTNIRKQPQEYTLAEWHQVLDTNLTSAFLCSKAVHPLMKKAGRGKIINIGSMMSIFGASFAGPYAASKGGIVQLTKAMASAWARDHIQVNAGQIQGLHERVVARTPDGRWGTGEDFAGIAVFLASPASDFITGTAIPVDGGYSVQG